MSSLVEDANSVELANLRADLAHAQGRIRELTEALARRTDTLHVLEGERDRLRAAALRAQKAIEAMKVNHSYAALDAYNLHTIYNQLTAALAATDRAGEGGG